MTDLTATGLPLDNTADTAAEQYDPAHDYHALNAMLNLYDADGKIQFDKDKAAEREYVTGHVATNSKRFASTAERLEYLISNQYYNPAVFNQYSAEFLDRIYEHVESAGFEFGTFLGAFKFYTSYALKTFDGRLYLEDFPQRCAAVALELAAGNEQQAIEYADEMLAGRFQPATPTFLNLGKAQRGEPVSCFLVRIEDNMESISRGINAALQLSKRGGGVALLLSNLRELGAPIKHIENQSSGVIPVMKLLEDSFSYANQLGARQGAGAVYLNAHHPDILRFLDTKRENADEKIRIKSLALGVVIPDITFELAKQKAQMALFSPYDVERVYGKPFADISVTEHYDEMVADDRIKKTYIDARKFFTTIAELQFESGYPYIVLEDAVNRANPIEGRVTMSNLCSEILQVQEPSAYNEDLTYAHVGRDISCNLGSLNIAKTMDGGLGHTVETAIRALTSVAEHTSINAVPSIRRANEEGHAIGLGQMNLHGFLAREGIQYGSEEGLDFTDMYFMTVAYHAYRASHALAVEHGRTFASFATSDYAKASRPGQLLRQVHRWSSFARSAHRTGPCAVRTVRHRDPDCGRLGGPARRDSEGRHLQPEPAGRAAHRLDLVHQPFHELDSPDRLQDRDSQGRQDRARVLPGRLHDQRQPRVLQGRLRDRLEGHRRHVRRGHPARGSGTVADAVLPGHRHHPRPQ